ncbi:MAG: hypothetical protein ACJ72Z_14385 [Pyrinomonadaceae bacterium]
MKQVYEIKIRPKLRLSEVERLIKTLRIIIPPPTRHTLIKMCEDGTFETLGNKPTNVGWLVFEDSFLKWAEKMNGESEN